MNPKSPIPSNLKHLLMIVIKCAALLVIIFATTHDSVAAFIVTLVDAGADLLQAIRDLFNDR